MNASRLVSTANRLPVSSGSGGGDCCCCCCLCQCLPCINANFLRSREGLVKLLETVLGVMCQNLLINYGATYSATERASYYSFLTTASSCIMTSFILLVTYALSSKSMQLMRQSIFEITFNGAASFMYISASGYLAVLTFFHPAYKVASLLQMFPVMDLLYILGFTVGILHGYDAWSSYNAHR